MDTVIANLPEILRGFRQTLLLLVLSGVLAAVLGTLLASMRVSPIPALRAFGTSYVNVFRNTPLLLVLLLLVTGLPEIGISWEFALAGFEFNSFFVFASFGLALYTGAFVCEAIRSGVNSVPAGQAEAARSLGMSFGETLRLVVLPQAGRAVIAPLASIYIALAKNTSVALAAGVVEATYVMRKLGNRYSSDLLWIFAGFALGYVLIVLCISGIAAVLERRLAVSR